MAASAELFLDYGATIWMMGALASCLPRRTRNNRGVAHENGAIESRHGHVKDRIAQALLLRGSPAFDTLSAYRAFVADVLADHNRRHAAAIDIERAHLRALPPCHP